MANNSIFNFAPTNPNIIYINSQNREINLYPSASIFRIKFATPILHAKSLSLLSCIIPNVFYLFRDDAVITNNYIDFIDSSGVNSCQITPGSYNSSQLIVELQNILNAASTDTYTVTYDPVTLKLTITSSSALFQLLGQSGVNVNNSALYYLGWQNTDTAAAAIQVAPYVLDMSYPRELFIKVQEFGTPIKSTEATFSALFQISLSSSYGNINYWEAFNRHETRFPINIQSLAGIFIELVDETGRAVALNGRDWSLLLRFE